MLLTGTKCYDSITTLLYHFQVLDRVVCAPSRHFLYNSKSPLPFGPTKFREICGSKSILRHVSDTPAWSHADPMHPLRYVNVDVRQTCFGGEVAGCQPCENLNPLLLTAMSFQPYLSIRSWRDWNFFRRVVPSFTFVIHHWSSSILFAQIAPSQS